MELIAALPLSQQLIAAAVFGALIGSFLNVVILRLPNRLMYEWRQQSRELLELPENNDASAAPPGIVKQASHCAQCKTPIAFYDNIPVLSFLLLRGRCRHCKVKLSLQYPVVELATAALTALCVLHFGVSFAALAAVIFTWTLIAATGIDLRTQLLPDQLTLPLLWLGLFAATQNWFVNPNDAIIGGLVGYLSLWSVYWAFKLLTGKEGMGYGDFKLLAALGAWVGWQGLLPIVLLSSIFGAVIGSIWLAVKGRDKATPIPFGPFLAIAGWTQFVYGEHISRLYQNLLG